MKIRAAVNGYGNLGRGVVSALSLCSDMELVCVFTRRKPGDITGLSVPVVSASEAPEWAGRVDVCILCGGSATDLPQQGPEFARYFNTVDSFDTHARIPEYFAAMDAALRASGHAGIISVGWDPGLFSVNRVMSDAILPDGAAYTFWGRGVSQGHSDAIRRIPGVRRAVQYTVPVDAAVEAVRSGRCPELSAREKHTRECWVVLEDGADAGAVRRAIVTMPHYFSDYDTTVRFIDEETFLREHTEMPHGGFVQRTGRSADGHTHMIEYGLKLGSNPAFTGSVLAAYARAAARMAQAGGAGAYTVLDVAPAQLSPKTPEELRARML